MCLIQRRIEIADPKPAEIGTVQTQLFEEGRIGLDDHPVAVEHMNTIPGHFDERLLPRHLLPVIAHPSLVMPQSEKCGGDKHQVQRPQRPGLAPPAGVGGVKIAADANDQRLIELKFRR